MKQTAVEFLIKELDNYEKGISEYFSKVAIRNNARRMEKQQIVDFGYDIADDLACGKYRDKKHMEERYNEYLTFKQQEQ
jgi:hypothetical protein